MLGCRLQTELLQICKRQTRAALNYFFTCIIAVFFNMLQVNIQTPKYPLKMKVNQHQCLLRVEHSLKWRR